MIDDKCVGNAFDFVKVISRDEKPRKKGISIILDKGLGLNYTQDLALSASYIDIVKLAWTTPRLFPQEIIASKIEIYKKNNILVCNGGTLLEVVFQQGKVDRFFQYCREIGLDLIEVSNGILPISFNEKANLIKLACSSGFLVVSEVGKKDPVEDQKLTLPERIAEARSDIEAGAQHVIIEAREGGKGIGVYDETGSLKEEMAVRLVEEIGIEKIIFEAPEKSQQVRLILLFGCNVNLANIKPDDVIPLETLRRGIRGDTFGKL